jgi:hypothetical protein
MSPFQKPLGVDVPEYTAPIEVTPVVVVPKVAVPVVPAMPSRYVFTVPPDLTPPNKYHVLLAMPLIEFDTIFPASSLITNCETPVL